MSSSVSSRLRRPPVGLLVVAALVAIIAAPPVVITLVNDAAAREVEAELRDLPLPEGTVVVDSSSAAGKFNGNGNGMQYLGGLLIRSDLPLAQLQAFYQDQPRIGGVAPGVADAGDARAESLRRAGGVFAVPADDDLFVVTAWGRGPDLLDGLFQTLDLRGH